MGVEFFQRRTQAAGQYHLAAVFTPKQAALTEGFLITVDSRPTQSILEKLDGGLFDEGVFGKWVGHKSPKISP